MAEQKSQSSSGRPRVLSLSLKDGAADLTGLGTMQSLNVSSDVGKARKLDMEVGPNWTCVLLRYVRNDTNAPTSVALPFGHIKHAVLDPEWRG